MKGIGKFLLSGVALASLYAVPVMAADLAVKAPPPAPTAVYSWTGFYVGANAGGTWADPSVDVATANTFNNTALLSVLGLTAGPAGAGAATGNLGVRSSGFIGGVQAGYNYQRGSWVAGVEADIQGVGGGAGSSTLTQVAPRIGFPPNSMTATLAVTERLTYLGTVRGRFGFLPKPSLLTYLTGGLAYGGVQSSTTINGAETPNTGSTDFAGFGNVSNTRVGYTVGAGLEWMFAPRWSVKAEYLYYDLGRATYASSPMPSFLTGSTNVSFVNQSSSSIRFNGNLARIGVNYELGPGPVVANY